MTKRKQVQTVIKQKTSDFHADVVIQITLSVQFKHTNIHQKHYASTGQVYDSKRTQTKVFRSESKYKAINYKKMATVATCKFQLKLLTIKQEHKWIMALKKKSKNTDLTNHKFSLVGAKQCLR